MRPMFSFLLLWAAVTLTSGQGDESDIDGETQGTYGQPDPYKPPDRRYPPVTYRPPPRTYRPPPRTYRPPPPTYRPPPLYPPTHKPTFAAFCGRRARQLYFVTGYKKSTKIAYKHVDLNSQGAFSGSTGVFTAPFSGLFHFTFHVLCHFDHPSICRVALVHKPKWGYAREVVHSWGTSARVEKKPKYNSRHGGYPPPSTYVTRSNNAHQSYIIYLNRNDQVWVQLTRGKLYDNTYGRSSVYTTFCGFSLGPSYFPNRDDYQTYVRPQGHRTANAPPDNYNEVDADKTEVLGDSFETEDDGTGSSGTGTGGGSDNVGDTGGTDSGVL